jgi:hypothetical protein
MSTIKQKTNNVMNLDEIKVKIANAIDMFECGFISPYELVKIIKTIMIKQKTNEK